MVNKLSKQHYVIKRNGKQQEVYLDKITSRLQKLCYGLSQDFVDPLTITLKVIQGLYIGVTTVEIDNMAAEIAAKMAIDHPDYSILATRISVTNLHKETKKRFTDVVDDLCNEKSPMISDHHYKIIKQNADCLNETINHELDYTYNYFGLKTLERTYLLRINKKVVERPQHLLMRVAIGIHGDNIEKVIETYNLLSKKYFIHASPTLYFASDPKPDLTSCFTIMMPDDSLKGIYKCLEQCAQVSSVGGQLGFHVHNIRAEGTPIFGTGGNSNGLVPMLRVFDAETYLIQDGSNEQSAFTVYLEPWHSDIYGFLSLKKKIGKDELRARNLNYALWIPDLFMKRVDSNGTWSLMCPKLCPGLQDCWGEEFEKLYEKYEAEKKFIRQVDARQLWHAIYTSQAETGQPYMLYKDACNKKSNQQHLGTIKSSNFSTEALQFTSPEEVAACPEASIALNMFVDKEKKLFDFQKLKEVTKVVTKNLNKIIDISTYPLPEAKNSILKHRPIGIGVQGLADAFLLLRIPFDSPDALLVNQKVFETIYYAALEASCELAETEGTYSTYQGSPVSKGILQYDMWDVTPTDLWDWSELKKKIGTYGVRNSLLVSLMPTTVTAEIMGNSESFEIITSNMSIKNAHTREILVMNQYLMKDLMDLGLWNESVKDQIIKNNGSIQNIQGIPNDIKSLYKTVWEISQKVVFNMAVDRGAFVDQSQAINIHIERDTYDVISSIHYYAWKKGLKTGMYNLRTKPVQLTSIV